MYYKRLFLFCVLFALFSCGQETDPKLAFEKGDYENAFSIWKIRADQDDLEAQNFLGIHYQLGLGVKRDFILARKWYEKAAISGYPDAQRNLGLMYETGQGLPRDFDKAFIWLYAAYRQGHPRAAASLLSLVSKLSPNKKLVLKDRARQYIVKDVVESGSTDF